MSKPVKEYQMSLIPNRQSPAQQPCTLYKLRSSSGELLYVGLSLNVGARLTQHKQSKDWWHAVARVDLQHYATRLEALTAEERSIRMERPTHNFVHNGQAFSKPKAMPRRCRRCRGSGSVAKYRNRRDGGVCFACKGKGYLAPERRLPNVLVLALVALLLGFLLVNGIPHP